MSLFKKNVDNEVIEPLVFADSPGGIVYEAYFCDPDGKFVLVVFVTFLLMFCIGLFIERFCFI